MPAEIRPLGAPVSRRQVMIGAAGLSFAVALRGQADGAATASERVGKVLSPWVSISPDGTVTILSAATEMGQGSMTSLPLVIAEELDADWDKVRIVPAPVNEAIYGNPGFGGMMYTAGSSAVTSYYAKLRTFGAQVRRMLLENAAKQLGVPVAELTTEPGIVVHTRSGRRLSYGAIAEKADVPAQAPDVKPGELKNPSQFRLIGKDVMRTELPQKINGTAQYSIDVQLPGMLYAGVVRAPVEGAKPEGFDEALVSAVRGVVKTVTLPYGIGVVTETPWAAFAGRDAVENSVRWSKDGKARDFDSDKGLQAFAEAARDPNLKVADWFKLGDARTEMSKAASTFEQLYLCDSAYHAQMEPLNSVAFVSPAGDGAEVWCGTQGQTMALEATAKTLGLDRGRVKLHDMLMGGGFGRRGPRDMDFLVDAVLLSKEVGRPVKVLWTREDDIRNGRLRPLTAHLLRAGFDASGKLVAWHHRLVGDRVLPSFDPVRYEKSGRKDHLLMRGSDPAGYDVPHQLVDLASQDTGIRTGPVRGIGNTANKFVTETFVDELAYRAGIDPLQYRLELLARMPRGQAVLQRVAHLADWGRRREATALGVAYINYDGTHIATVVELSVEQSRGKIKLHNAWCAIDCGVAVQPDNIVAQVEGALVYGVGLALTERISIKDGVVQQSNFYDYLVPRNRDVPPIQVALIRTDNHPTGVGEVPTPTVMPAVSNALMALTKVRLRHAPFTEERVKAALG